MPHPLDHPVFSNIPEQLTPEEFRRRFRERCAELLRQLDDPEWYSRQMRPRPLNPGQEEFTEASRPALPGRR